MPRAVWSHFNDRPRIQIEFQLAANGQKVVCDLIADSGAGNKRSTIDLILDEHDCILYGGVASTSALLGGAFTGTFPVYNIRVQVPPLGFNQLLRVVGVPAVPAGFDGIASFRFLNRFTYGNFGDPDQFGVEM